MSNYHHPPAQRQASHHIHQQHHQHHHLQSHATPTTNNSAIAAAVNAITSASPSTSAVAAVAIAADPTNKAGGSHISAVLVAPPPQPLISNSLAIRQEIQRFESVHPSIYAIYDLIDLLPLPDAQIAQQIRDHVVCIEGSTRSISSQAVDFLEELKDEMRCGFPKYGIPPLAPFKLQHKQITFDGGEFGGACEINNFVLHGLNEYEIREFKVNAILRRVNFDFLFKSVNFTTTYDMDVGSGLRYKSAGGAFFALEDLLVKGQVKYSMGLTSSIRLKEVKIYVSVGNVNSQIENLSKYKIINRKLNEVIEEWFMLVINENTDYVADQINEMVVPLGNDLIGDTSIVDIISSIGGGGGSGEKQKCLPTE